MIDQLDRKMLRYYGNPNTPEEYEDNPIIKGKKVVVLIPTHNNESLLPVWFNFIYKLNPQPIEYVFAENNSHDDTLKLIERFKRPTKLIRVWFKKKPIGKGESFYTTIAHIRQLLLTYARQSNCDYAIFLDTDIFPATTELISHMINWNADIVGGKYMRFFPEGLFIASYWKSGDKKFRLKPLTDLPFEEVECTSAGCLCLSKKVIQDRRVNFYPIFGAFHTSEDFAYCRQARARGYKVYLDSLVDVRHFCPTDKAPNPWTFGLGNNSYSRGESRNIKRKKINRRSRKKNATT